MSPDFVAAVEKPDDGDGCYDDETAYKRLQLPGHEDVHSCFAQEVHFALSL
jgi:hypothetical protein